MGSYRIRRIAEANSLQELARKRRYRPSEAVLTQRRAYLSGIVRKRKEAA